MIISNKSTYPKIGEKKICQNPFQAIIRLKKKVAWTTKPTRCREGKTLVVQPLKKTLFFMCVFPKLFKLLGKRNLILSSLNTALNVAATLRAHISNRFPILKLNIKEKCFFSSSYLYVYYIYIMNHLI